MTLFYLRRLLLGPLLIATCSAILLYSDLERRQRSSSGGIPRVAVVQHASQAVLDEGVRGMLDAFTEAGLVNGKNISLQRFNAQNDLPTANAIAKEITSGTFDFILTASTLSLQTVANANKAGKAVHIFGISGDPFSTGAGLNREDPMDHPRHIVGIGTFLPVAEAFRLAKLSYPGLESVGLVWNATETTSESFTREARKICQDLTIELLEANVDNSSGVSEAANSLVSRGAQALFVSGDVTVLVAVDAVIEAGRKGGIPVFTIIPPNAEKGALFDLGANFYLVGKQTGEMAIKVILGTDPATLPIEDLVPPKLVINLTALKGLREPWKIPQEAVQKADTVIDDKGFHEKAAMVVPRPPEGKTFKMGLVYFAPEPGADSCMKGLFDGLQELGFEEGKNLEVKRAHAQGEIANITALLQNYDSQQLDLIVSMTTPCLTAACSAVSRTPVVFTYVYDPIAAGAGQSFTDHLPHVTGVGSFPPVQDTVQALKQLVPDLRVVGTLYNSSEANSRKVVSVARDLFARENVRLEEVAIISTSEVFQAAQVLAGRQIQAYWITGDNTALQAFSGIAKVALDEGLPLIINDPEFTDQGALASLGVGWYQTGKATARTVARVLLGEKPQAIPFENVSIKKVQLNFEVAEKLGLSFPSALLQQVKD